MEAFNLKFVGEVEKYQELYNYTLQAYSKRDVTDKAWNNVAKAVDLSVNECKEKWRNLRTTFVRSLKPKPSGSGAIKKKPYYLIDAMQFAVPYIKVVGKPTGNLPKATQRMLFSSTSTGDVDQTDLPDERNEGYSEEMLIEPISFSPSPPFPAPISTPSSANQEDRVATPPPSEMITGRRGPHGHPIRRRKFVQSDAADKAFTEYFSAKLTKLSKSFPPKDVGDKREEGVKNFLLSLIPDLMKLDDIQLRMYKRRALLFIDEVDDNSPNNNST